MADWRKRRKSVLVETSPVYSPVLGDPDHLHHHLYAQQSGQSKVYLGVDWQGDRAFGMECRTVDSRQWVNRPHTNGRKSSTVKQYHPAIRERIKDRIIQCA